MNSHLDDYNKFDYFLLFFFFFFAQGFVTLFFFVIENLGSKESCFMKHCASIRYFIY